MGVLQDQVAGGDTEVGAETLVGVGDFNFAGRVGKGALGFE